MTDTFRFDDRRLVVTGGATGVGAALLVELAALGATAVTVLDVVEPSAPHDVFIRTDLSDPTQIDAAVAQIEGPVAALFNNAGVADTMPAATVFAVNLLAVRRLTALLTDQLIDGGAVVNTASIAGIQWPSRLAVIQELLAIDGWDEAAAWFAASSDLGVAPYPFTKECLQVFTMQAAPALGRRGIRINSVCPAPIDTKLLVDFRATMSDAVIDWTVAQGDGRLVTPTEVAAVLAFLGSAGSAALNGTNIPLDHGFSASMTTGQLDFTDLGL